jgi:hypothetical protein
MFVVLDKRNGQPLRMRDRSAQADPVICFETRQTALEWMNDSKVAVDEFDITEIAENHQQVVARMMGIAPADVNFTMLRSRSFE